MIAGAAARHLPSFDRASSGRHGGTIGGHPPLAMPHTTTACQSCGMSIDAGPYCRHCVDEHGRLQSFEERFLRMTAFAEQQNPRLGKTEVETRALDAMAGMPAWRDHPRVREHREQRS